MTREPEDTERESKKRGKKINLTSVAVKRKEQAKKTTNHEGPMQARKRPQETHLLRGKGTLPKSRIHTPQDNSEQK